MNIQMSINESKLKYKWIDKTRHEYTNEFKLKYKSIGFLKMNPS